MSEERNVMFTMKYGRAAKTQSGVKVHKSTRKKDDWAHVPQPAPWADGVKGDSKAKRPVPPTPTARPDQDRALDKLCHALGMTRKQLRTAQLIERRGADLKQHFSTK